MSVRIKPVARRNPLKPTEAPKYYAVPDGRDVATLDAVANQISKISSISRGDVYSVLLTLLDVIPGELLDGKVVQLGKLGSFALNLKSEPAETPEAVTADKVTKAHIVFRPSSELKATVSNVHMITT